MDEKVTTTETDGVCTKRTCLSSGQGNFNYASWDFNNGGLIIISDSTAFFGSTQTPVVIASNDQVVVQSGEQRNITLACGGNLEQVANNVFHSIGSSGEFGAGYNEARHEAMAEVNASRLFTTDCYELGVSSGLISQGETLSVSQMDSFREEAQNKFMDKSIEMYTEGNGMALGKECALNINQNCGSSVNFYGTISNNNIATQSVCDTTQYVDNTILTPEGLKTVKEPVTCAASAMQGRSALATPDGIFAQVAMNDMQFMSGGNVGLTSCGSIMLGAPGNSIESVSKSNSMIAESMQVTGAEVLSLSSGVAFDISAPTGKITGNLTIMNNVKVGGALVLNGELYAPHIIGTRQQNETSEPIDNKDSGTDSGITLKGVSGTLKGINGSLTLNGVTMALTGISLSFIESDLTVNSITGLSHKHIYETPAFSLMDAKIDVINSGQNAASATSTASDGKISGVNAPSADPKMHSSKPKEKK